MSNEFDHTINTLFDKIEEFFSDADQWMVKAVERGAAQIGVAESSCITCATPACCYLKIFVYLFEVFPLARHLRETGRDTPELRQQLEDVGNRMENSPTAEWLDGWTPCPLLTDGKCSVYAYRPVRCRTQFVFSPADLCKPPSGKEVKWANDLPILEHARTVATEIHRVVRIKETSKRILLGSFPRVLYLVLRAMDEDVNFREFLRRQQWPSNTKLDHWLTSGAAVAISTIFTDSMQSVRKPTP